jgi:transposase
VASAEGATHIAMEATGVYWKPVWHILSDGEFELVLANAAHVKNVPGRKTDVNDATWLADLMAHGLIRASFVPDEPTQQMRDLLRTRKQFVRERSSHIQRIQKTLEDANIKLDSVSHRYPWPLRPPHDRGLIAASDRSQKPWRRWPTAHPCHIGGTGGGAARPGNPIIVSCCGFTWTISTPGCEPCRIDKEVDANVEPFRAAIEMLSTIPGISSLRPR